LKTQVLIIGGGITGTGIARDLALRGIHSILIEKEDLNAGASGGNHGLLHSGARYIEVDPLVARECQVENRLLKQLAPQCIEDTGGLFVAIEGDDESYISDFPSLCDRAGIPVVPMDVITARDLEPSLSPKTIAVYGVEDAAVDPFRLTFDNIGHAQELGSQFLPNTRAVKFIIGNRQICHVRTIDTLTCEEKSIETRYVVNAAGTWSDQVTALADISFPMIYSKGSLLVTQHRITHRVINRMRKASNGDILVPGGTVSILGTTSIRIDTPQQISPTVAEVDQIISQGAAMLPELETTRYIRAYSGVRPLTGPSRKGNDRDVSRGFSLIKHSDHGVDNFLTITGGKLTTFRLMSEKATDEICRYLGVDAPCQTAVLPLPAQSASRWTEPGSGARFWIKNKDPKDMLLCGCEMVPQSSIDSLVDSLGNNHRNTLLRSISNRSRIGKGPCQGMFCSTRVMAYLYHTGMIEGCEGIEELKSFLRERWRGQHPIMWGARLIQAELQEAMHCGLLGLELADTKSE